MSLSQQPCTPADLRNAVTEVLQSEEFCNQLRCSIERASSNTLLANNLTASPRTPVATPADELRRLFPSIRGSNNNDRGNTAISMRTSLNNTNERKKIRKKSSTVLFANFKRDVILLKTPDARKTLTGLQKSSAYEKGYAISAATFQKTWNEHDIVEYIKNLFEDKLLGTKFEILVPISGTLVKPNLPEGTVFDGVVMCRLFAQKVVYVRPLSEITQIDNELYPTEETTKELESTPLNNYVYSNSSDHHGTEINSEYVDEQNDLCDASNLRDNLNCIEDLDEQGVIQQVLEDDVEVAIALSLEKNETLIDILKDLHTKIDNEKTSQFNIYRDDVFNCCIRGLRRKKFSPLNRISVLFTDVDNVTEGAVDMGGPTREMFTLLLKYLQNSNLFEGPKYSKNITLYNEHVESEHYYEAGRIIALSLIHGGPSPNFLSNSLFDYLVTGVESTKPGLEEVVSMEIRKELEDIQNANNLSELQQIIWNSTFLNIAGFPNVNNFDKKDAILQSAIKYYIIYRTTPALEQFKKGLNIVGLLEKLKVFREDFRRLMCCTDSELKLTAATISTTFTVIFSEIGSNKRNVESRILSFWKDYLLDCEESESEASLEDVLCFATACNKIPPLGFDKKPQLEFLHDEEFYWPKGNTCSLTLFLPVSYKSNEYEKFKKNMDFGILNGMQFGFA